MKILAFGADGKGRFALAKGKNIKLSRDFGNLRDAANFERYERAIRRVIRKEKPGAFVCDLHPDYNSTKLAKKLQIANYKLQIIQHHHAHIASAMFENGLKGRVIGAAFDGTGFGSDGNIWGGEFFIASPKNFKRAAHLAYIPMPGGEMAVREPWRMAFAYLYRCNIDTSYVCKDKVRKEKASILKRIMEKKLNSPLTSSAGRLFDAAGALINGIYTVSYEGEAAIKLEKLATGAKDENSYYDMKLEKKDGKILIHPEGLIKGIVKDLRKGVNKGRKRENKGREKGIIAMKFHNSIARMIYNVSKKLCRTYNVQRVVLSGGVFQNNILLERTKALFKDSGLILYTHKNIPTTDAGIPVGQAILYR